MPEPEANVVLGKRLVSPEDQVVAQELLRIVGSDVAETSTVGDRGEKGRGRTSAEGAERPADRETLHYAAGEAEPERSPNADLREPRRRDPISTQTY